MRRWMALLGALAAVVTATSGCSSRGDAPAPSDASGPITVEQPAPSDAGGPITVEQLFARSADTPIVVRGLLHVDGGTARLCDAILESDPPQCGEPSVELVGLDLSSIEGTATAEGVTWKEGAVLNVAYVAGGRFMVVDVDASFTVQVVLGIYSGLPDPAWTLSAEQANTLSAALARLSRVDGPAPSGGLGYHGFTIINPDGTLVAYMGKVASAHADPPYVLDDPDRTIERLMLDAARAHVTPEELAAVTEALDE